MAQCCWPVLLFIILIQQTLKVHGAFIAVPQELNPNSNSLTLTCNVSHDELSSAIAIRIVKTSQLQDADGGEGSTEGSKGKDKVRSVNADSSGQQGSSAIVRGGRNVQYLHDRGDLLNRLKRSRSRVKRQEKDDMFQSALLTHDGLSTVPENERVVLDGQLSDPPFLQVTILYPKSYDAGMYQCTLTYFDQAYAVTTSSMDLAVDFSNEQTPEDTAGGGQNQGELQRLSRAVKELSTSVEDLKKRNQALEDEVAAIKTVNNKLAQSVTQLINKMADLIAEGGTAKTQDESYGQQYEEDRATELLAMKTRMDELENTRIHVLEEQMHEIRDHVIADIEDRVERIETQVNSSVLPRLAVIDSYNLQEIRDQYKAHLKKPEQGDTQESNQASEAEPSTKEETGGGSGGQEEHAGGIDVVPGNNDTVDNVPESGVVTKQQGGDGGEQNLQQVITKEMEEESEEESEKESEESEEETEEESEEVDSLTKEETEKVTEEENVEETVNNTRITTTTTEAVKGSTDTESKNNLNDIDEEDKSTGSESETVETNVNNITASATAEEVKGTKGSKKVSDSDKSNMSSDAEAVSGGTAKNAETATENAPENAETATENAPENAEAKNVQSTPSDATETTTATTTTTTTTSTTTNTEKEKGPPGKFKCAVCGNMEAGIPCTPHDFEEMHACPPGANACITEVVERGWKRHIFKTCATADQCADTVGTSTPACADSTFVTPSNLRCSFCCISDSCNDSIRPTKDLVPISGGG